MALARAPRRRVDGVLLLDKPRGLSSNVVLQRAKRLLAAEKAGHTGTLDPLATGLLPLCFGEATKFAHALLDAPKEYVATVAFGQATTTGDAEGEVLSTCDVSFSRDALARALREFVGTIAQTPPRFAALKHQGRNYYEYARAGVEIPRAPREVRIDAIELLAWEPPQAVLRVACGKGTYIRALADDLGQTLGCGAHLAALRRTGAAAFDVRDALTPDALEAMSESERDAHLLPIDGLLVDWPVVRLESDDAGRFLSGLRRRIDGADAAAVRVYGSEPHAFLGSAHIAGGELIADRLLSPLEVRACSATATS